MSPQHSPALKIVLTATPWAISVSIVLKDSNLTSWVNVSTKIRFQNVLSMVPWGAVLSVSLHILSTNKETVRKTTLPACRNNLLTILDVIFVVLALC